MSNNTDNQLLADLFAKVDNEIPDQEFTHQLMNKVEKFQFRKIALRALVFVLLAVFSAPFQDWALLIAQSLTVALVNIEHELAAAVLTPINTVGGLLSGLLLALRLFHRRLFE